MASVRLRHPKGVSTIALPSDLSALTVSDLQQQIYSLTDIPPSRQILRSGYPPRPLAVVPELPLSSLAIQRGEQIIVNEAVDTPTSHPLPAHAATPRATPRSPAATSDHPDHVQTGEGVLVHRIVPDDNSCLFSSIALVFEQSISKAPQIRKIVAEGIKNDPGTYNEAILGMPPAQYVATILRPTSWGGAIELSILAAHYRTEIASVDVETGRIDHFTPPGGGQSMRCILIYSGIHYDAASLAPMADAPPDWHQTLFPVTSGSDDADPTLSSARKLGDILRAKKAFTNTATFDLKCEDCGLGLKGEKGAREHANQTGHIRFGEY